MRLDYTGRMGLECCMKHITMSQIASAIEKWVSCNGDLAPIRRGGRHITRAQMRDILLRECLVSKADSLRWIYFQVTKAMEEAGSSCCLFDSRRKDRLWIWMP